MPQTIPLRRFIREQRVSVTAEWEAERPDHEPGSADDERWYRAASHYRVTIRRGRRRMAVHYSMGPAHTDEPTAEDVLDSLASDAASYEAARSFDEWASDYGYDPDSRRAERMYRAIERQAIALRRVMADAYDALLYGTDRL